MQVNFSSVDNSGLKYNKRYKQRNNNVSFGKVSAGKKMSEFSGYISPREQTLKRVFEKLKELKGEAATIVVTAVGTGLVAPLMIGFNPFMRAPKDATPEEKEEVEKTKKYSAWRQPVSAVLALIFQLGAQPIIDKHVQSQTNNPDNSKFMWIDVDRSILQDEKYILRTLKNDYLKRNEAYNKALELDIINRNDVLNLSPKELNKKLVEAYQKTQENAIINDIIKEGQIKYKNRVEGDNKINEKSLAQLINDVLDDNIKELNKLRNSNEGIEYYINRGETLINHEQDLKKIFNNPIMKKDNVTSKDIKDFLNNIVNDKNTKPEMQTLLNEIIQRGNEEIPVLEGKELEKYRILAMKNRMERTLERIEKIKTDLGTYSKESYREYLEVRNGLIEDKIKKFTQLKMTNLDSAEKELTSKDIQKLISEISEISTFEKLDSFTEIQKQIKAKNLIIDTIRNKIEKATGENINAKNNLIKILDKLTIKDFQAEIDTIIKNANNKNEIKKVINGLNFETLTNKALENTSDKDLEEFMKTFGLEKKFESDIDKLSSFKKQENADKFRKTINEQIRKELGIKDWSDKINNTTADTKLTQSFDLNKLDSNEKFSKMQREILKNIDVIYSEEIKGVSDIKKLLSANFKDEEIKDITKDLDNLTRDSKHNEIDKIKKSIEELLKKSENITDETKNTIRKELQKFTKIEEAKGKTLDNVSKNIGKKIVKGFKNFLSNKYTGISQFIKVIVGAIITLPITCTALNYVYPKFMEAFFPELAGVKKGGKN